MEAYTVAEFAKKLKISEGMARKMIRNGQVRVVHIGDRIIIPAKVIDDILDSASSL